MCLTAERAARRFAGRICCGAGIGGDIRALDADNLTKMPIHRHFPIGAPAAADVFLYIDRDE